MRICQLSKLEQEKILSEIICKDKNHLRLPVSFFTKRTFNKSPLKMIKLSRIITKVLIIEDEFPEMSREDFYTRIRRIEKEAPLYLLRYLFRKFYERACGEADIPTSPADIRLYKKFVYKNDIGYHFGEVLKNISYDKKYLKNVKRIHCKMIKILNNFKINVSSLVLEKISGKEFKELFKIIYSESYSKGLLCRLAASGRMDLIESHEELLLPLFKKNERESTFFLSEIKEPWKHLRFIQKYDNYLRIKDGSVWQGNTRMSCLLNFIQASFTLRGRDKIRFYKFLERYKDVLIGFSQRVESTFFGNNLDLDYHIYMLDRYQKHPSIGGINNLLYGFSKSRGKDFHIRLVELLDKLRKVYPRIFLEIKKDLILSLIAHRHSDSTSVGRVVSHWFLINENIKIKDDSFDILLTDSKSAVWLPKLSSILVGVQNDWRVMNNVQILIDAGVNYDLICQYAINLVEGGKYLERIIYGDRYVQVSILVEQLKKVYSDKRVIRLFNSIEDAHGLRFLKDVVYQLKEVLAKNIVIKKPTSIDHLHRELSSSLRVLNCKNFRLKQDNSLNNLKVGEYTIRVPQMNKELVECGVRLGICVGDGNYAEEILGRECFIFFLKKKGEIEYCIEVSIPSNQIVQVQGKNAVHNHSRKLREEIRKAIKPLKEIFNTGDA